MSANEDKKLEAMLRQRRVEPASPDLAARILLRAQSLPQLRNISLWQFVHQLFAEFHLPKPGYVLASALVLGIVVGFSMASDHAQISDTSASLAQSYIAGDEGLL
jgi:hypothetical protein